MRNWILLICICCILSDVASFAANAPADDDEYEEVIVRRKKKKRSPTVVEEPQTVVAPVAVVPAATVIVPAVVTVPAVTVPEVPSVPAVTAPEAPSVPAAKVEVVDEPPPPPEPPAADAAEPRRLVRYFCRAWKDKDYERLWWAMSPQYRKKVSLKKLKKLFESDAEMNGGLLDENILETAKTRDGNEGVKLELIFKFPRAKHRIVMAVAERQTGGAFRIVDSPFIPQDLDDL